MDLFDSLDSVGAEKPAPRVPSPTFPCFVAGMMGSLLIAAIMRATESKNITVSVNSVPEV